MKMERIADKLFVLVLLTHFSYCNYPLLDVDTNMRIVLVPHDMPLHTPFYRIKATDSDLNFPLNFEVLGSVGKALINLSFLGCSEIEQVCQVDVFLKKELDVGRTYEFQLRVTDTTGDYTRVKAAIMATDGSAFYNLMLPSKIIEIPEDTEVGSSILSFIVTKNELNSRTVFLELREPENRIELHQRLISNNRTEGTLILRQKLDFEKEPWFTFQLLALNGYTNVSVDTRNILVSQVIIGVQDIQDTPPKFLSSSNQSHFVQMTNATKIGDLLMRLEAEDGDTKNKRLIRYGLLTDSNPFVAFFNLDSITGELYLKRNISELIKMSRPNEPIQICVVAEEIIPNADYTRNVPANNDDNTMTLTNITFWLRNVQDKDKALAAPIENKADLTESANILNSVLFWLLLLLILLLLLLFLIFLCCLFCPCCYLSRHRSAKTKVHFEEKTTRNLAPVRRVEMIETEPQYSRYPPRVYNAWSGEEYRGQIRKFEPMRDDYHKFEPMRRGERRNEEILLEDWEGQQRWEQDQNRTFNLRANHNSHSQHDAYGRHFGYAKSERREITPPQRTPNSLPDSRLKQRFYKTDRGEVLEFDYEGGEEGKEMLMRRFIEDQNQASSSILKSREMRHSNYQEKPQILKRGVILEPRELENDQTRPRAATISRRAPNLQNLRTNLQSSQKVQNLSDIPRVLEESFEDIPLPGTVARKSHESRFEKDENIYQGSAYLNQEPQDSHKNPIEKRRKDKSRSRSRESEKNLENLEVIEEIKKPRSKSRSKSKSPNPTRSQNLVEKVEENTSILKIEPSTSVQKEIQTDVPTMEEKASGHSGGGVKSIIHRTETEFEKTETVPFFESGKDFEFLLKEEDEDSGIGLVNIAQRRSKMLEKKSIFTIAYDEVAMNNVLRPDTAFNNDF